MCAAESAHRTAAKNGRGDQKIIIIIEQLQDKEKEPLIKTDKLIAICVFVTLDLGDDQVAGTIESSGSGFLKLLAFESS